MLFEGEPMPYRLREYAASDRDACLAVFASNTPTFFREHEQAQFADFLDRLPCPFFVVEDENSQIIGCGGYAPLKGKLCWGMVDGSFHRHGVGRFLLAERLRRWYEAHGPTVVGVSTSQHAADFFQQAGFKTWQFVENGYAPGLHRYEMELTLDAECYLLLINQPQARQHTE
jgi:GNAT superfamily N-acetyltransferase